MINWEFPAGLPAIHSSSDRGAGMISPEGRDDVELSMRRSPEGRNETFC
jgi:hypothetical protein